MKLQFCYSSKTAPRQGLKLEVSLEEWVFFFSLFDKPQFEWLPLNYLIAGGIQVLGKSSEWEGRIYLSNSSLKGGEHTCHICSMLSESTRHYTLHNNWVNGKISCFHDAENVHIGS